MAWFAFRNRGKSSYAHHVHSSLQTRRQLPVTQAIVFAIPQLLKIVLLQGTPIRQKEPLGFTRIDDYRHYLPVSGYSMRMSARCQRDNTESLQESDPRSIISQAQGS
jgi:hypothetical protein